MADPDFERRLELLFADAPAAADADAFADRLEARLGRGWTARRWLIGAAGVVGGLIAASQLLFSGLLGQMGAAEASARAAPSHIAAAVGAYGLPIPSSGDGVVWTAIAVAVVLTGFVVTRVIEEI
jgi:hypothetical protein